MIRIGARRSPLSLAQVEEVLTALPPFSYKLIPIDSRGDLDRTTSLRTLVKDNFFTDTLDQSLLQGKIDVAIHSAKDLPAPLPDGLSLIALTKSLDPSDSLVLRPNETVQPYFRIATSSIRREKLVQALFPFPLHFLDLRGTIAERLALLHPSPTNPNKPVADGVVVAEAALIRLHLTHLSRISIPGSSFPLQGRLAIIARTEDTEDTMIQAFFGQIHDDSLPRT